MRNAAVFALIALTALSAAGAEGVGPYSFQLAGKAFDERCLKLAAGESIRYAFKASVAVDFNIHYHRGKDVFFPVKQSGVREASGTFRADHADDYCLMWEHKGEGAAGVEGVIERANRR